MIMAFSIHGRGHGALGLRPCLAGTEFRAFAENARTNPIAPYICRRYSNFGFCSVYESENKKIELIRNSHPKIYNRIAIPAHLAIEFNETMIERVSTPSSHTYERICLISSRKSRAMTRGKGSIQIAAPSIVGCPSHGSRRVAHTLAIQADHEEISRGLSVIRGLYSVLISDLKFCIVAHHITSHHTPSPHTHNFITSTHFHNLHVR